MSHKARVIAVLIGSLAFPAAHAQGFDAATLLDYSGQEIFERFCAACHGESARGDGPVANSLTTVVPDLTRIAERNGGTFPNARIVEYIDGRSVVVSAHGTRTMPVWGYEFWVEEGADVDAETEVREVLSRLLDYLQSIQVYDERRL